ncbi:hypothetical protein STRMA_0102 [Streptococcus macacae NCTC 11558]|uniref:Uncharacterized protein n=1 Tax=Streptococcus macacae NCTC 11558 TaxID=764298 RepID=G5JY42_9STRE|nr:hypothetical protein STRMA_0102 [Streptococcus macacae NCTC 11558]
MGYNKCLTIAQQAIQVVLDNYQEQLKQLHIKIEERLNYD